MGVYIKGVTVEELMKVLICSTEFMPDGFEIVQTHDVSDINIGDMVSRSYLLAEYDRQHKGTAGKARKIIEEAPSIEQETIKCKDCVNLCDISKNGIIGTCCLFDFPMYSFDWCSRAERRTDDGLN